MPRVIAVFEVGGAIEGVAVEISSLKLTLLDGGLLLGRVTCAASEIALIDGKANLDLFESTDEHQVFSCRFSLVKVDGEEATIVDCAARVSQAHGLVGRWNGHGSLGRTGVCDHAVEMKSVRATENSRVKHEASDEIQTVSVAAAVASTPASSSGVARKLRLSGDAVDQNGNVYTTTLQATLHIDGTVTGVSTELGRQCNLVGSWSDNAISYTLDFPINGVTTQYSYRGVLETDADGSETLSGTWKYERQSATEDELFGGFSFTSLNQPTSVAVEAILPGEYVFTGSATSDGGTRYDSKLTLTLASGGSLSGKSEELSIAPQTCELQGSWDTAEKMITYRMIYSNGSTGSYEYVGKLHDQQFVGRWVNPRAADRESERGNFVFTLTSFQAASAVTPEVISSSGDARAHDEVVDATQPNNSLTSSSAIDMEPLKPGQYILTGSATSDGGTTYDSKLTLCLATDGSLVGESEELSIAPQVCKLEGSWESEESSITYLLIYTNGSTASYDYVGQLDGDRLVGRWTNSRVKDCEAERGDFTFKITSFTATATYNGATTETSGVVTVAVAERVDKL